MKLVAMVISILLLFAIWTQTAATQAQQKPEELAQKSVETWLALTDSAKYAESWDEASQLFKNAVTKEQWSSTIRAARDPLGKVQSRKLKSATYSQNTPRSTRR